jgi:peptidoglycan hydrolase CwlO-like protein
MSVTWVAALGPILSVLITAGFGYLIKRSSDKANTTTRRDAIEAGAFARAKDIYDDALDRAQQENRGLVEKINHLEGQVTKLQGELETERGERRHAITTAHREISDLRIKLAESEVTITQLRRVIASQRRGDLPTGIDLGQPPDLPGNGP